MLALATIPYVTMHGTAPYRSLIRRLEGIRKSMSSPEAYVPYVHLRHINDMQIELKQFYDAVKADTDITYSGSGITMQLDHGVKLTVDLVSRPNNEEIQIVVSSSILNDQVFGYMHRILKGMINTSGQLDS
jgi:hypothetical protein